MCTNFLPPSGVDTRVLRRSDFVGIVNGMKIELTTQELQELQMLEERLWIADFRFDLAWMEKILAEDFFEFGRSGRVYSRAQCLDATGVFIDAVIPFPDFKARYLSTDIVQTTYTSAVTDNGIVEYGNRSSIWIKTSEGWKLKFHQGTPVKEVL